MCNPAHNTSDYTVNGNGIQDVVNIVAEAMVAQVRAGLNNNVSCPKRLGLAQSGQECPPGGAAKQFGAGSVRQRMPQGPAPPVRRALWPWPVRGEGRRGEGLRLLRCTACGL